MPSKLGVYWSVMHRRAQDYDYFKRLQPTVFKIMDGGPPDYQFARDNLPGALVIARDWALSEQHTDMLKDPVGTGKRHAQEWNQHQSRLGFDRAKTLILGINEPRVWEPGLPEALRQYTIAMCDKATELGLRVGAMQLSVGWPGNNGPDTPPNWEPFHGVDNAIRRNNGALVLHEYWADSGPGENWGWWGGRALKCPWQVPIVIGECGVDMYVKDGSVAHAQRGWRGRLEPARYAGELAEYVARMSEDSRFVGCAVFAADFASHEWFSFDIEPAYAQILAAASQAKPPLTTHLPQVGSGPTPVKPPSIVGIPDFTPPPAARVPQLTHPIADPALRVISQRFGDNAVDYARFGLKGHNGLDFAVGVGTPMRAVDAGVVQEAGVLPDYGTYIKLRHPWGESVYAHLNKISVAVGEQVSAGEVIALSGNSGDSTGPHLHFAIRVYPYTRGGDFDGYSDPAPYLAATNAPVTPAPQPANLLPLIKEAAAEFSVDWRLLASLAWAESSWRADAVSAGGAQGVMQFMSDTWQDWRVRVGASDPLDARGSLRAGAAYFRYLSLYFAGNERKALWAWNWGMGRVGAGKTPPVETIEFASKVLHGRDLLRAIGA